jgi:hypothetical protein
MESFSPVASVPLKTPMRSEPLGSLVGVTLARAKTFDPPVKSPC